MELYLRFVLACSVEPAGQATVRIRGHPVCMKELIDGQPLFPGESDVDQLYIIQRMLGPLTRDQNSRFMGNPRFNGYKFGDDLSRNPRTLESRYGSKMLENGFPHQAIDFMKRCLRCVSAVCFQAGGTKKRRNQLEVIDLASPLPG